MSEGLLVGGWVITGVDDRESANVLRDGAVVHRDGIVVEVSPSATMRRKYPLASVDGSADHAILPGFVKQPPSFRNDAASTRNAGLSSGAMVAQSLIGTSGRFVA
jgi:hypothetical protein